MHVLPDQPRPALTSRCDPASGDPRFTARRFSELVAIDAQRREAARGSSACAIARAAADIEESLTGTSLDRVEQLLGGHPRQPASPVVE